MLTGELRLSPVSPENNYKIKGGNMTVRKARVKKQIKQRLGRLSPEESREVLAEIPNVLEKSQDTPGQIQAGRKKIYTRKDLDRLYGICEFTPDETIPVTFQGVRYQLLAGVTMSAPTIIRDIYENHKRELRRVGMTKSETGYETIIAIGAGALEPE